METKRQRVAPAPQGTGTRTVLDLPVQLQDIALQYVPAARTVAYPALSRTARQTYQTVFKPRLVRRFGTCPRQLRPVWHARRKGLYCPWFPTETGFDLGDESAPCCLPPTIETREDMERVFDMIVRRRAGQWRAFYPSQHLPGEMSELRRLWKPEFEAKSRGGDVQAARAAYIDREMWGPYLRGQLVGLDFGQTPWTDARVIYRRDPETGVLRAAWPDAVGSPYEYIRWLAASEVPDDYVEDAVLGALGRDVERYLNRWRDSDYDWQRTIAVFKRPWNADRTQLAWDIAIRHLLGSNDELLHHFDTQQRPQLVRWALALAEQQGVVLEELDRAFLPYLQPRSQHRLKPATPFP